MTVKERKTDGKKKKKTPAKKIRKRKGEVRKKA
jgi:hypothetical protein